MNAASNAVMPKDPRPTPMRHKRKGLAGGVQWKGDWADGILGRFCTVRNAVLSIRNFNEVKRNFIVFFKRI